MNQKKAKKLRKIARQVTPPEQQETRYITHPLRGVVACTPQCCRGIYKTLKKGEMNV